MRGDGAGEVARGDGPRRGAWTPLLLLPLFWPLAAAATTPAPPPDLSPASPEPAVMGDGGDERAAFRILFDGRTGGVSSGRMEMGVGDLLFGYLETRGARIDQVSSTLGALYGGGRYLWTDDGLLSGALAFLEPGGFEVVEQVQPAPMIRTDRAVLLQGAGDADTALLDSIERSMRDHPGHGDAIRLQGVLTRYRNADGDEAWVAQGPGTASEPLPADPTAWEVRIHETFVIEAAGSTRTLHLLSRMVGEGSRRKALVDRLRTADAIPTLVISAGNAVEGHSFLEGEGLSLARPLSWAALADSGLRLLAPGHTELLAGLDTLSREAAEAGVTLLAANLRDADGNAPFEAARLVDLGGTAIAVIGVVDPAVSESLHDEVASGMSIEDPVPAVGRALRALRAGTERDPDLVVLLAGFGPAALGELAAAITDVDVVIGAFGRGMPQTQRQRVTIDPGRRQLDAADRRPLLVIHATAADVGEIVGFTGGGRLRELSWRAHPITQLLPVDEETLRGVMAVRQRVYLEGEAVLVPDLRDLVERDVNRLQFLMDGQPYRSLVEGELASGSLAVERIHLQMTPQLWSQLCAAVLQRRTAADVVVLPPLPWPFSLSGPTRELYASAYLAVPDELQLVELTGSQLLELLRITGDARTSDAGTRDVSSHGDVTADRRQGAPWVVGMDASHAEIGGRPLSATDTYRVLTTDALASYPGVTRVLSGASTRHAFRDGRRGLRPAPRGDPRALRTEVLQSLRRERAAAAATGDDGAYDERLADLLRDRGDIVHPLVYLRADTLSLTLTRYLVEGDQEAYANVRESRVTTEESFNFGLRAQGAAGIDTDDLVLETKGCAVLSVTTVGDADPTELEDDLQVALDAGLKGLSVRSAPIYPFLQGAYDTEFMRADETDDAGNVTGKQPRQKDLRGTVGVTASSLIPTVSTIKAGTFIEHDFSAEEGALEAGMSLEVAQKVSRRPVTWSNTLMLYGWFPTRGDTDEDLLLSLNVRTELGVTFWRNLQFKTYVDLLAYKGKVAATAEPGLSTIVGVELAFSGTARRRIWR